MSEHFIERARYLCSLGGAVGTVTALPGAVPILHSASGCAGNFAWTQNGGSQMVPKKPTRIFFCGAARTAAASARLARVKRSAKTVFFMDVSSCFFILASISIVPTLERGNDAYAAGASTPLSERVLPERSRRAVHEQPRGGP